MLVLSRKAGEGLKIGENIEIHFLTCEQGQIRIGIEAPKTVNIARSELLKRIIAKSKMSKSTVDPPL